MKFKFTILLILLMVIMIPISLGYTSTIPAWQGYTSEIYENNGMHYFIPLNVTDSIYQNIPIYTTFYLNNVTLVNMQITIGSSTKTSYQITLSNNQNVSTPTNFQQLLQLNLTSLNINNLGGLRFYDQNNNPLYAWLESYNSSSGIAYIWINLSNNIITANGTLSIYMTYNPNINFDGIYMGEAPQLSPTYAEYDNGANVFSLYVNGNTPISDFTVTNGFTLTQATGVAYGSSTINALKLTGYSSSAGISFYLNTGSISASQSWVAEGNGQWYTSSTSGDTNIVSLIQSPSSSPNAIGVGGIPGYGNVYFDQEYITAGTYTTNINPRGAAGQSWIYGSLTYIANSTTYSGYTAPQLYSTSGGYSGTTTNPISSIGSNLYLGVIGDQISGYPANAYWNFLRVRAYPPNGVMPSISSISTISSSYVISNCTDTNIEILNNYNSSTIFVTNSTGTTMISLLYPATTLTIMPNTNTPMSSEAIFQSWELLYWSSNTQYVVNVNDLTTIVMITVLFLITIMIVVMLVAIVRGSKL